MFVLGLLLGQRRGDAIRAAEAAGRASAETAANLQALKERDARVFGVGDHFKISGKRFAGREFVVWGLTHRGVHFREVLEDGEFGPQEYLENAELRNRAFLV